MVKFSLASLDLCWWPDKMVLDKMVRTKCHGQNGSNFYRHQFNWYE